MKLCRDTPMALPSARPFRALNYLGGLLLLGAALGAQEPGTAPDPQAENLMERALNDTQLRAAARRAQGAEEAPADVTVLSGQELRALGYRTVGAALAGVLGFRDNGDRAYENVGIRGLYVPGDQNTRLLVLLDGHPLNSPAEVGSSKVGEDFGIPMARIDRIEIIRGPASSLYGNNAFLGVVNVVTLEAGEEGPREMRLGLSGGTGGLTEAWASLRLPLGRLRIALNAGGFRREGTATRFPELSPDTLPAELDREHREHAYLFLQGEGWSFSSYLMNRVQRLPHAPFASLIGSPENHYQNRIAFGEFRAEPRFGALQTLFRAYWDWNLFTDRLVYDGLRDPATLGTYSDRDLDRGLGGEAQLHAPLGETWSVTGGLEQAWHRFEYTLTGPDSINPREVRYRIRKLYGEAEWSPDARFSVTLGVQRSDLLLDEGRSHLDPSRTFTLGSYGRFSPRLAWVWRPREGDTWKGLYSEGFRNPTVFERFSEDDGLSFVDNPNLGLEALRSGAILWLRDWGKGWSTHVGLSALRWTEAIRAVDLDSIHQQFQNDPEGLRDRSLEVQVRHRKGAWDVLALGAIHQWSRAGQEVDNAARSQVGLRVIRTHGAWSFAGEWRGVGPRSLEGYGRIPFQSTLRASVRWERGAAHLQITGEDLLDAKPQQWVAPDYAPIRRLEADGRQVRLDLGWRF